MSDLRFAMRMLLKSPGFTAVAVLTLAIGIGANSALFSLVNAVLLSPLPFEHPERLVMIRETDLANNIPDGSVSGPNYIDLRDRSRSFEAMTACAFGRNYNLSGRGEPIVLQGAAVTPSFARVFAMPVLHGRASQPEDGEPGNENRVILSHRIWQRQFGSDPRVVGQTITLDGRPHEIVGVAAPLLGFIEEMIEVYIPLPNHQLNENRGSHYLQVFGRLKPGVTAEQGRAELATIMAAIAEAHPDQKGRSARVDALHERLVETVRPAFLVLYAAVALVLFIACANVANLLLARSESRSREIAVRAALGAGRGRIIRQLLTESVTLSLFGAVLGLGFARAGIALLRAFAPRLGGRSIPFFDEITIDVGVLGFTLAVAMVTGLAFGLVPAWHLVRTSLVESLKESSRGGTASRRRHRTLGGFVVLQFAVSVMLLVAAGLLIRNFQRLTRVHPGFEAGRVLTMETDLPGLRYTNQTARLHFYERMLDQVQALPGVESCGAINILPMANTDNSWAFDIDGAEPLPPGRYRLAEYRLVSPDLFSAIHVPLKAGRWFTRQDNGQGQRVAVVNETLVRRHLAGTNAVGRRIRFGRQPALEIVGVVGDVKHFGLGSEVTPTIYQPMAQDCWGQMSLVVRARENPTGLTRAVQEVIWSLDQNQPVTKVQPMERLVSESISVQRFSAILLTGFAVVGLLLSAIGIYGVQAYIVNLRTQEIGVRMALGARVPDILRLVIGRGMLLAVIGLVVGLIGALGVSWVIKSQLYQMNALDPVTFVMVPLILALVALTACWLPARRAAQVDPMVALRCE